MVRYNGIKNNGIYGDFSGNVNLWGYYFMSYMGYNNGI